MKCFFPIENFHFDRPKKNFSGFKKWHFVTFPPSIFNFPPSLLQFSFFSSQFSPLFPCVFFPGRSAEISRSEVSGGTLPPLLPHCIEAGLGSIFWFEWGVQLRPLYLCPYLRAILQLTNNSFVVNLTSFKSKIDYLCYILLHIQK